MLQKMKLMHVVIQEKIVKLLIARIQCVSRVIISKNESSETKNTAK